MLTHRRRRASIKTRRRREGGVFRRRVAATVVAIALVVAAEVDATLSAVPVHQPDARRVQAVGIPVQPSPYGGEPHLSKDSRVPGAVKTAAVRFVRDYGLWSSGRLAAIPATDATQRVIRLLEQEGRPPGVGSGDMLSTVQIAPSRASRYVVTSVLGNFLVGSRQSWWFVISLPGD